MLAKILNKILPNIKPADLTEPFQQFVVMWILSLVPFGIISSFKFVTKDITVWSALTINFIHGEALINSITFLSPQIVLISKYMKQGIYLPRTLFILTSTIIVFIISACIYIFQATQFSKLPYVQPIIPIAINASIILYILSLFLWFYGIVYDANIGNLMKNIGLDEAEKLTSQLTNYRPE